MGLFGPERTEDYKSIIEQTEGWFNPGAAAIWSFLLRLQASAGIRGDLIELGVWHGKSGVMLSMAAAESETALLVDHRLRRKQVKRTFGRAPKRAWQATQFIECESSDLAKRPEMEGRRFRWFHIDAEHSMDAVRREMDLAHETLVDDGIVSLDDIFSWMYPHITDELFRYLREHPDRFSLFLIGYKKAYLCRPHKLRMYMEQCHANLLDHMNSAGVDACLARTARMHETTGFSIGSRGPEPKYRGRDGDNDCFEY